VAETTDRSRHATAPVRTAAAAVMTASDGSMALPVARRDSARNHETSRLSSPYRIIHECTRFQDARDHYIALHQPPLIIVVNIRYDRQVIRP
jgi:hypothetical protein